MSKEIMTLIASAMQALFFVGVPAWIGNYFNGDATIWALVGLSFQLALYCSVIGGDLMRRENES